jgi:hypothetical protein
MRSRGSDIERGCGGADWRKGAVKPCGSAMDERGGNKVKVPMVGMALDSRQIEAVSIEGSDGWEEGEMLLSAVGLSRNCRC